MNRIERIISRYRLQRAECDRRCAEIDDKIERLREECEYKADPLDGRLRPVLQEIARQNPFIGFTL